MSFNYKLLNYKTYNDYLQSFSTRDDGRYVTNIAYIEQLMMLGYRCHGASVYTKEEFEINKQNALERLNPKMILRELYSRNLETTDPVLEALADREEANVVQNLSTIIFMQLRQRSGFDISGYIDYAASLHKSNFHMKGSNDWKAIFQGRAKLHPKTSDLSYFDWHSGIVEYNDSDNYHTVASPIHGLYFIHKGDHKRIPVTKKKSPYKENVDSEMIYSKVYGYVTFYDHYVRKKI